MRSSKQSHPVFLSLLQEAARSETRESMTRDEALHASREAARELKQERSVRPKAKSAPKSVAKRTQTTFADVEVTQSLMPLDSWNDGPFAVEACRAEPKLAINA